MKVRLAFPMTASGFLALPGSNSLEPPDPAEAPKGASRTAKIVLVVREQEQLLSALHTAHQLMEGAAPGLFPGEIRIIACGDAVGLTLRGVPLEAEFARAEARGITVAACGVALGRWKMDADDLALIVAWLPDGLEEAARLEASGWLSYSF